MKWNISAQANNLQTATPNGQAAVTERKQTVPVWVKALVFWHVFAITVWSCPKPNESIMNGKVKPFGSDYLRYVPQKFLKYNDDAPEWDKQLISMPIQCYLFTTGTWQYWDMFAPNPASIDFWGDAVVVYKDKTSKVYQYPRMLSLSIPEKYVKERYRKFYERAHDETYPYLFPQFALRVALLNYTDPNNPPVKVGLRRHWQYVADPGQPQAKDYSWYTYYTGIIDQKQLKQMAHDAGKI